MNVLARSRAESVKRVGRPGRGHARRRPRRRGSHCLMAVGSIPNTAGIGPGGGRGPARARPGYIEVDKVSRTTAPGRVRRRRLHRRVRAGVGRRDAGPDRDVARPRRRGGPAGPARRCPRTSSPTRDRHRRLDPGGRRRPARSTPVWSSCRCCATPRAKMQGIRDGFVKMFCRPGHRDRGRRRGRRAAGQRADPPDLDRGRQQRDRRADRARVHRLPVAVAARSPRRPGSCTRGLAGLRPARSADLRREHLEIDRARGHLLLAGRICLRHSN